MERGPTFVMPTDPRTLQGNLAPHLYRFAEDFADWLGAIENTNAFDDEIRKMEKAYGEIFSSQLAFAQSLVAPAMVILSAAGAVLMGLTLYQPLLGLVSKVMGKMM
jgi:hypothetical protein